MTVRTRFITRRLWDHIDPEIAKKVRDVLIDEVIFDNYLSNIENELRIRGYHLLADDLLNNVETIGPGEPTPCAECGKYVLYGRVYKGKVYHVWCAPF
ncbi:hypothetical protein [Thermosinus carboxydivorans]|uniref:hypothetical protein n=1 Tax=Thermosinus carboxydivorans TaxID=261685 RepID=UPI0005946E06|nr:hypothetical protein [Thermosinus carboxydivorans]